MSLRAAVARYSDDLTDSDRKAVDVLMRDLRESVFMPAADVARLAQVHESTVVRLAQKLGFAGYAELREAMRVDVKDMDQGHSRLVKLTEDRGYDLASLVLAEAQALMRLPDFLSQADLDESAQLLLDADHVFIYGNHYAEPLVSFLDRRLRLLGFRTSTMSGADSRNTAEHAGAMREGDLLFVFALRRDPGAMAAMIKRAEEVGAKTIVLTDVHGLPLATRPTKLLLAPRGADEDFRTQVVPHLVCYALQLSLYHLAPERCEAALNAVDILARATGQPARTMSRTRRRGPDSEIAKDGIA